MEVFCRVLVVRLFGCRRCAEGSDFNNLAVPVHMGQAETSANEAAIAEHAAEVFRVRISSDIEIFRLEPQKQIANPAPDQKSLVTGVF